MLILTRKIGQRLFVEGPNGNLIIFITKIHANHTATVTVKNTTSRYTNQPMLLEDGCPFIECKGDVKIYLGKSKGHSQYNIGIDADPMLYKVQREEIRERLPSNH